MRNRERVRRERQRESCSSCLGPTEQRALNTIRGKQDSKKRQKEGEQEVKKTHSSDERSEG